MCIPLYIHIAIIVMNISGIAPRDCNASIEITPIKHIPQNVIETPHVAVSGRRVFVEIFSAITPPMIVPANPPTTPINPETRPACDVVRWRHLNIMIG